MGNAASKPAQHQLYILRVSNMSLPLCPFIHAITKFGDSSVSDTDPRAFREILSREDLRLEILDLLTRERFSVCVPRGTERLGLNVIKTEGPVHPLNIRVINAREGGLFRLNDQILGLENLYIPDESSFVQHIKDNIGKEASFVIIRNGAVVVEAVELSNDMGCEIASGILFKPDAVEYRMRDYDGSIKKETNEARKEVAGEGARGVAEAGDEMKAALEEGANPNEAAENAQLAVPEPAGVAPDAANGIAAEAAPEHAGPDANQGAVATADQPQADETRATEGGKGQEGTREGCPAFADHTYNDHDANDRICEAAGIMPESSYVAGMKAPESDRALLVNGKFASADGFVNEENGLVMTKDAFDQRRESIEAEAPPHQNAAVAESEAVPGYSIDDRQGERSTASKGSIKNIFNESSDDELPFASSKTAGQQEPTLDNGGRVPNRPEGGALQRGTQPSFFSEQPASGAAYTGSHRFDEPEAQPVYASRSYAGAGASPSAFSPSDNSEQSTASELTPQSGSTHKSAPALDDQPFPLYSSAASRTRSEPALAKRISEIEFESTDEPASDGE
ncbi:hypothetical protein PAPHI01_0090 [Pancytospora philotis]|nr:hypothetical protein PAPHI01_0090 [Pancytospora philotis]